MQIISDYLHKIRNLLASTPQQLQALLNCLRAFGEEYFLEVNVPKCAVVVFGQRAVKPADLPPGGWLFADQPVPLVTEFWYLGILFIRLEGSPSKRFRSTIP